MFGILKKRVKAARIQKAVAHSKAAQELRDTKKRADTLLSRLEAKKKAKASGTE